ncbi:ATP-binding cassette domain-containing protein [Dactylosporangium fulvum]|uniref:Glutathione import ATP-binding protein GsiA n=1 Tax=Dactylosporangium fulvum TaxID=53359 RepID=A0ABY5W7M6_9ACTN|nr:ATP-binding cassette domain-containing protein [Dactylosporangium fulvum]UWP85365.1 ATP-binding cassette domain-containing protein [Dactylosporangium fulvum]
MKPILELTDVVKRFPLHGGSAVHAVEHVSLSVPSGRTVALVGESGCGKSTLANLAMRLDKPDSGSIVLDGVDITHLRSRALRPHRRKIQMVFQDPFASLNPRAAVGNSVAEPLRVHGTPGGATHEDRVAELFRLVGLDPSDMAKYPHQFSGGQRQRVCIARALASEPSLVVADEATSALDVSVRARVLNLFMELQEKLGIAYLFVSHDLAVVERVAHQVAVMRLGQIVEFGSRQDIFTDPRHPYTRRLLEAVPVADPDRRRTRDRSNDELVSPVRPRGSSPERVTMHEVSPGHWVAEPAGRHRPSADAPARHTIE